MENTNTVLVQGIASRMFTYSSVELFDSVKIKESALVSFVVAAQGEMQRLGSSSRRRRRDHGICVIEPAMGEHFVTMQVRIRWNDDGFEATDWAHRERPEGMEMKSVTGVRSTSFCSFKLGTGEQRFRMCCHHGQVHEVVLVKHPRELGLDSRDAYMRIFRPA